MKIIKKICLVILSIMLFISSTIIFSLISVSTFLKSGIIEEVVFNALQEIESEDFIVTEDKKITFDEYDENGKFVKTYELDVSNVDLSQVGDVIKSYITEIIDYSKSDDENKSINLESNRLSQPLLEIIESVVDEFEKENNYQIDQTEIDQINSELSKTFEDLFEDLNKYLNSEEFIQDMQLPVGMIGLLIDGKFIVMTLIFTFVIIGLIFIINRNVTSLLYVGIPIGLSGLLLINIVLLFGFYMELILIYLSVFSPFIIGIGLGILYYLIIRNKQ